MNLFSLKNLSLAFALICGIFSAQNAKQALANLDKIAKDFNKNTYYKFSYLNNADSKAKKNVGLYYGANDKFKFRVMQNEQLFDGHQLVSISHDEKEITITKAKNNAAANPFAPIVNIKKDYKISYVGTKKEVDQLKLQPIKHNKSIYEILIFINHKTKKITQIQQFNQKDQSLIIEVLESKQNMKLDDSVFKLNKAAFGNYLMTEI